MEEYSPSVAIVILNYNGLKFLKQFLPFVMASEYENKRIIIADNASTDGSLGFLRNENGVELIVLDRNYGFAEGYNQALEQIEADYFILLNSDVEVSPNWIKPVIDLMEKNIQIGACQPKIKSFYDKQSFEYAGAAGGFIDKYGYPFARGRVFENVEIDRTQYDQNIPIFWASGAALFIKREAWEQVGGFDGYFFAHQEEVDLCWRLQLIGWRIFCCTDSIVYHIGGGTLPKSNPRKLYLNIRNSLIMLAKNLETHQRWSKIFIRLVLDGVFGAKLFFTGKWKDVWAIIKAHFGFYKWYITVKKSFENDPKTFELLEGVVNQSIVFLHYIKGKKYFSEIIKKK